MILSSQNAKLIQSWLEVHGGSIDGYGAIDISNVSSPVIENWLSLGANVFYNANSLRISNWPRGQEFKVTVPEGTSKETVTSVLKRVIADVKVEKV